MAEARGQSHAEFFGARISENREGSRWARAHCGSAPADLSLERNRDHRETRAANVPRLSRDARGRVPPGSRSLQDYRRGAQGGGNRERGDALCGGAVDGGSARPAAAASERGARVGARALREQEQIPKRGGARGDRATHAAIGQRRFSWMGQRWARPRFLFSPTTRHAHENRRRRNGQAGLVRVWATLRMGAGTRACAHGRSRTDCGLFGEDQRVR